MIFAPYHGALDWAGLIGFLSSRAVDGVERTDGDAYRRTTASGWVEVTHDAAARRLRAVAHGPQTGLAATIRRVFDLDADVAAVGARLSRDPGLAPLVAARPGLRSPGAWTGFEMAVRAVLGQQVSVAAGRGLACRLVALCGPRVAAAAPGLTHAFPGPAELAAADLASLGMPGARRAALLALARAALDQPDLFTPPAGPSHLARLLSLPGIGPWTAHYIMIRALRDMDAFPASDVGMQRGAAQAGVRPTADELLARAERWRPWRAYAAQHLWAAAR